MVHTQFENAKQVEHMVLENTPPSPKKKKPKLLYITLQLLYFLKYML